MDFFSSGLLKIPLEDTRVTSIVESVFGSVIEAYKYRRVFIVTMANQASDPVISPSVLFHWGDLGGYAAT